MYSDRINCYHPGWRSPPEVCVPAKSTANSSVEEASLPSDVVEHFYIIACNHLPTMLYNVVHAQRLLGSYAKFVLRCFQPVLFCSIPPRLLVRVG